MHENRRAILGQLGANWMLFWAILAPTRTKLAPRRPKDEKTQENSGHLGANSDQIGAKMANFEPILALSWAILAPS